MSEHPPLTTLSDDDRTAALARFKMIQPFLEDRVPLGTLALRHATPVRTLRRWVQQYRHAGLSGLIRKIRGDKGTIRITKELTLLVEALAIQTPALTISSIHRKVTTIARREGWAVPSYSTVHGIVKALDPALRTLAQEGTKAYHETFDLIHRHEAARPNTLWQGDHTPLDIWVQDDTGTAVRPWLTIILDDYSRAIAGYMISLNAPSAMHTALVLRDAIWRKANPQWPVCGIPETFYTDHGSDFTSQHIEQVCADLKISLVFSMVGRPRGRGKIERFFGTVNQLFLQEQPGYTPPGTAPAPAVLTLRQLQDRLHTFLMTEYHHRQHSETQQTPLARWEAGDFLPALPESLEQLDLLLLTVTRTRKVHQDGIHFQGMRYLDVTLTAYVGESVLIRYDPRDLAEIRVYHEDRFLCRAICHDLASDTISLKDLVQARTRERRRLRDAIAQRQAVLATYSAPPIDPSPAVPAPPEPQPLPESPAAERVHLKRYIHE